MTEVTGLRTVEMMRLICDCHTHTDLSHGRNTASEMIRAAYDKGLGGIWITEHGPAHMSVRKHFYKSRRDAYLALRDDIEREKSLYPGMDIRFGTEANVTGLDGETDAAGLEDVFEFINVGYHMMALMKDLSSEMSLQARVIGYKKLGMKFLEEKFSRTLTEVMLRVLDNYDINMITHPTRYYPMDMGAIAAKCAERGTLLEINSAKKLLNAEQIRDIIKENDTVRFAVGSDAHRKEDVGEVSAAFSIIEECGLTPERLANIAF
ncbi:MAG: PHP domain-containing protein [Eubacteriaceae bacterium]|nr:PHP domain-containing protein [Eubacteriaceae bacterium]